MTQQCLIVLGMHRSGTSCLTGTIEQCGVFLGEVFTENPFNKKGNRESAAIQELNNEVLELNGGAWDKPVSVVDWTDALIRQRDAIIAEISSASKSWWGFKDPRVVLTLPFWLEAIPTPSFVGTFRHPHRVALSLEHRNRMSYAESYALWGVYNKLLIEYVGRYQLPLVNFDLSDTDYQADVVSKLASLGLTSESSELFFDPHLRHQSREGIDDCILPDEIADIYQRLQSIHAAV